MSDGVFEFRKTIALAREGSEEAFKVLVERYGVHVQRYVKRRIGLQLQTKIDEEDLAQMVWASFFTHRSRVVQFDESKAMVKYLIGIATNKLNSERDRYFAEKRSVRREQSLDEPLLGRQFGDHTTPSQVAIHREALAEVLNQCSPRDRRIVRMWLDGSRYAEIAELLQLDESTVGKVIRRVRQNSQRWSSYDN